eukprot:CAMPEP_0117456304 /NCGR_PEP_ID=MMETSP0759-20121206/11807_1 /TAXON_ID=63605 /ORGANISM="Percolomonas cosmopolitus, Strain WS" /LENGTH=1965 /DNA_ID=CAMNT_0005249637 /DNA_START=276 /DNA_END=6170 /DNA_ORIENTATION=-
MPSTAASKTVDLSSLLLDIDSSASPLTPYDTTTESASGASFSNNTPVVLPNNSSSVDASLTSQHSLGPELDAFLKKLEERREGSANGAATMAGLTGHVSMEPAAEFIPTHQIGEIHELEDINKSDTNRDGGALLIHASDTLQKRASILLSRPLTHLNAQITKKSLLARCGSPLLLHTSPQHIFIGTSMGFVLVFHLMTLEMECILGSMKEGIMGVPVTCMDVSPCEGLVDRSSFGLQSGSSANVSSRGGGSGNVVLVGYGNGHAILWDVLSAKILHHIKDLFPSTLDQKERSSMSNLPGSGDPTTRVLNVSFLQDSLKFIATNEEGIMKFCKLSKSFFGYSVNVETIDRGKENRVSKLDIKSVNYVQSYVNNPSGAVTSSNGDSAPHSSPPLTPRRGTPLQLASSSSTLDTTTSQELLSLILMASSSELRLIKMNTSLNYSLVQVFPEYYSLHASDDDFGDEMVPYIAWWKGHSYDDNGGYLESSRDLRLAIARGNTVEVRKKQNSLPYFASDSQKNSADKFDLEVKYVLDEDLDEEAIGLVWMDQNALGIITLYDPHAAGTTSPNASQVSPTLKRDTVSHNKQQRLIVVDPTDFAIQTFESFKHASQYVTRDNKVVTLQDRIVHTSSADIRVDIIPLPESLGHTLLHGSSSDVQSQPSFICLRHNHIHFTNGTLYILQQSGRVQTFRIKTWKQRLDSIASSGNWDELFKVALEFYYGRGKAVVGLPFDQEERANVLSNKIAAFIIMYVESGIERIIRGGNGAATGSNDPSQDASHELQLRALGERSINLSMEISQPELVFQEVFPQFAKHQHTNLFLSLLVEFVSSGKLPYISSQYLPEFLAYGKEHVSPILFEKCLKNIDLSVDPLIVKELAIFASKIPEFYGAYTHAITKGYNDYETPMNHLMNEYQVRSTDANCVSIHRKIQQELCNVFETAMDEDPLTRRDILLFVLDEVNQYRILKTICTTADNTNRFLNILLDVLMDNATGEGTPWRDEGERTNYILTIWRVLDDDKHAKRIPVNALYQYTWSTTGIASADTNTTPQGATPQTPTPSNNPNLLLSQNSVEVYLFLSVIYLNDLLEMNPSHSELLERLFIYLIKRHSTGYPLQHPRIKDLEDTLKQLLRKVEQASVTHSQRNIIHDKFPQLKVLAEGQKLNSLVVDFYHTDGKKDDELKVLLDRVEGKDYEQNPKSLNYDVKLIMEFHDRGRFVIDQLKRKLQTADDALKVKRINIFFCSFLSSIWEDAKVRAENNGTNVNDELFEYRNIKVDRDFYMLYLSLLVESGDENTVIQFLEEQLQLDLDQCLVLCEKMPNAKAFLHAQKGDTEHLLQTIISDLEEKKMALLHRLCEHSGEAERRWKVRLLSLCDGDEPTELIHTPGGGSTAVSYTAFDLQYYKLVMELQGRSKSLKNFPKHMPFRQTVGILNEDPSIENSDDHRLMISKLTGQYKSLKKFDFGSVTRDPQSFIPNMPLEEQEAQNKLIMPHVRRVRPQDSTPNSTSDDDFIDVLDLPEYQELKRSIIKANDSHLSHISTSKTLDDADIQSMWFRLLDEPFLSFLRALRYGFVFEVPPQAANLLDDDVDVENEKQRSKSIKSSTSFNFDDSDSDSDVEREADTIPGLKTEINECSITIDDLKSRLGDNPEDENVRRQLNLHQKLISGLRLKLREKEADAKQQELAAKRLDEDVYSAKNINKLVNLWYQRCIADCIQTVLDKMIRYVDVPSIIEKIINTHAPDDFSQVKNTIMRLLDTYAHERMLLKRNNVLLSNDTFKVGHEMKHTLQRALRPQSHSSCDQCGRDIRAVGATDDATTIRVYQCGHVFHSLCAGRNLLCSICNSLDSTEENNTQLSRRIAGKIIQYQANERDAKQTLPLLERIEHIDSILDSNLMSMIELQTDLLGSNTPKNAADRALEELSNASQRISVHIASIEKTLDLRPKNRQSFYTRRDPSMATPQVSKTRIMLSSNMR